MPGKCVVVCVWRRSQWAELVSGRLSLGITVVGIPVGMQCFKFGRLVFSPLEKRCRWWRSWVVPFEYHLADCIRSASCTGASGVGYSFMCDDYRNPVWFTAV